MRQVNPGTYVKTSAGQMVTDRQNKLRWQVGRSDNFQRKQLKSPMANCSCREEARYPQNVIVTEKGDFFLQPR
jgi:hypothetical protein